MASHPLFPVVAALWFGALFGLGSLCIRLQVLEELARSSRLDLLIPIASPPFGMTARILLALALCLIGGAIGGAIARRIARPRPDRSGRRRSASDAASAAMERHSTHSAAPARKPISVREDLPEVAIAAPVSPESEFFGSRRRPLTLPDEPRTDFVEFAPLPGEDWYSPAAAVAQPAEPLDLADYSPPTTQPALEPEPAAAFTSAEPADEPAPGIPTPWPQDAQPRSALSEIGSEELMQRLAASLQRRRRAQSAPVVPAAVPIAAPELACALPRLRPQPPAGAAADPAPPTTGPTAMPNALRPFDFGALDDDADFEDLPARHLPFTQPGLAAMQGTAADELAASLALSRQMAATKALEDEEPAEIVEEAYSSLIDMTALPTPPRQDFVRIADEPDAADAVEPVVIFPGQSPAERLAATPWPGQDNDSIANGNESAAIARAPQLQLRDPEETERALRAALASLQRMSGAA